MKAIIAQIVKTTEFHQNKSRFKNYKRQLYSDFWSCLFVCFDVICCLDCHIYSDGDCFDDVDEIIEFPSWWACLEAAWFKCIKHSRLSQFEQFKVEVKIIHRDKTKGMEHTRRDKKEFLDFFAHFHRNNRSSSQRTKVKHIRKMLYMKSVQIAQIFELFRQVCFWIYAQTRVDTSAITCSTIFTPGIPPRPLAGPASAIFPFVTETVNK